jgi:hypothetical protein
MDRLDTNGDGQIGFDELANFAQQTLSGPPASTASASGTGAATDTGVSTTAATTAQAQRVSHHYQGLAMAGQEAAAGGPALPAHSSVSLSA